MDRILLIQLAHWIFALLAIYGAVMGFVNYQIHKALKEYLEAKGLGE